MASAKFKKPRPNPAVMRLSGYINEWALLLGLPGFRRIPFLRNIPPFGGYFKVNSISIPDTDYARLHSATSPTNAFFLGPNHPEFTTDWLIDKYIATRFAPRMSSWASSSIIRGPLSSFWSANNLIGNDGGDAAKDYSISCALNGHGTLLHPEGAVRWRSDKVFNILPGIVEMSVTAAQRARIEGSPRTVYIVPIIWKMTYDQDITAKLTKGVAQLEQVLRLPRGTDLNLGCRYVRLHQNLLANQMRRFGVPSPSSLPRIEDAQLFFDRILSEISTRYGVQENGEDVHRTLHRLLRKAREAKNQLDIDAIAELQRLAAYSRHTFEKDFFYQEEIADGIQYIRQMFLTGFYNSVKSMLPKPFGWRTVHVRIPNPINVSAHNNQLCSPEELKAHLLRELKVSMDSTLNQLNEEFSSRQKISM